MPKKGYVMSEDHKQKIADALRGKVRGKQSPEFIEKRIAKLRGRKRPPMSAEWRAKISKALTGRKLPAEVIAKIVKANIGKKHVMPQSWRILITDINRARCLGKPSWNKGLIGYHHSGSFKKAERHWNWRGGLTPSDKLFRRTPEYKAWRNAVFHRDDYRCYDCGQRGGELHPDHLYPFSSYPRLRYMLENGRTLCAECHRKSSTYGFRLNNDPMRHSFTGLVFTEIPK